MLKYTAKVKERKQNELGALFQIMTNGTPPLSGFQMQDNVYPHTCRIRSDSYIKYRLYLVYARGNQCVCVQGVKSGGRMREIDKCCKEKVESIW